VTLVGQCEGADNSKLRITEARNIISLEKGPKWNPNNRNGGTFPDYVAQLKDGFHTYGQERQDHSQETQVERLVGGVKAPNNATMQIAIEKVKDDFKSDFDGAAQYLANKIVEVYGNEVNSSNKNNRNVWDTRDGGRGRGRGRGGRGRGRGRGRGGRGGNGPQTRFNGVDCKDVSKTFSNEEFSQMGDEGRRYVHRKREEAKARGGNHDSNKRQVQEMNRQQDEEPEEIGSGGKKQATGEKGAQNGNAFGRRPGKQNP
jgi:hypothetical protein